MALIAKVEHAEWENGAWRHGCRLLTPLNDDAFRRLQKLASDKNRKLIEIAHMILTAEEAFGSSK